MESDNLRHKLMPGMNRLSVSELAYCQLDPSGLCPRTTCLSAGWLHRPSLWYIYKLCVNIYIYTHLNDDSNYIYTHKVYCYCAVGLWWHCFLPIPVIKLKFKASMTTRQCHKFPFLANFNRVQTFRFTRMILFTGNRSRVAWSSATGVFAVLTLVKTRV